MFEGLNYFLDLMDVSPVWPIAIVAGLVILCLFPYKPVYKVTEEKDENGNTVKTVWKYRDR